jgi:SnoaL-like domain
VDVDTETTASVIAELLLDVVHVSEPPAQSVEEAVERIQHREAIHNVLVAYCYFQDERRWSDSVSLFTENCERTFAGTLDETVNGRDALLAAAGAPLKRTDPTFGTGATREELSELRYKHLLVTEMIKLGPGNHSARVVAYCQVVATRGTGDEFERGAHEATYYIEFQRPDDSGWLINRMIILTDNATNPLFNKRVLNNV